MISAYWLLAIPLAASLGWLLGSAHAYGVANDIISTTINNQGGKA